MLVRVTGLAGSVGIWYLYSTESKAKVSQTMLQCRQKSVGDENREGINKHVSAAKWRVGCDAVHEPKSQAIENNEQVMSKKT